MSEEAVRFLVGEGASLIITVDCGVSSYDEVELANSLGIDVIVTDHHVPPEVVPNAVAIIDPGMPGDTYPFPQLCGAGLAYKVAQGLYELRGLPTPRRLLELASVGTIADMVPLRDENRYIVQEGLAELSQSTGVGLQAMYRLANLGGKPITAETVAYQIAPRLNAAGRMGHAGDSLRLLVTRDEAEAEALANQLEEQNRQRRELTHRAVAAASAQLKALDEVPPAIVIEEPSILPGIAGLVAGQLARDMNRPAVALAALDNGHLIGSARSIPEFNLIAAFNSCADLFVRHGGHAQAAGFTIHENNVDTFRHRLEALAAEVLAGAPTRPALEIDAEVGLAELSPEFLEMLEQLKPFGVANPNPVFLSRGLSVERSWTMGANNQHLKLLVTDRGKRFPALLFNRAAGWPEGAKVVSLAYTITADFWQGNKQYSLVVEDFQVEG